MAIRVTRPANCDFGVTVTQHLFASQGKTAEITDSTDIATFLGRSSLPDNVGAIDIWCASGATIYVRFDGKDCTTSDFQLTPGQVFRFYGYKYILDRVRFCATDAPGADESESSVSGTEHTLSLIMYCDDTALDEWMSSSSSGSSSTSSWTNSQSSASTVSDSSSSSTKSASTSSSSDSSESTASADDEWQANNG